MTAASIMDVNQRSVDVQFAETGAHWMIHGHTHRPAIHRMDGDRRRIVLGDWPHTASWLRIAEDGAAELVFAGCRERLKLC